MSRFDPLAIGSDIPRSRRQYWTRRIANVITHLLGLNGTSQLSTEIAQSMNPVATIKTKYGPMISRAGHGRLVWRAQTFFSEEPDTITWLESLNESDVLWDVGANVGLYSIYAAMFRKCTVFAFEPEAQNYAILMQNLAMNGLGKQVRATNIALTDCPGFGRLQVRYVTKGGAYNLFQSNDGSRTPPGDIPESVKAVLDAQAQGGLSQLVYGTSIDDLVLNAGFPAPTYLKIDVDGIEPKIIAGAAAVLSQPRLRSVLIEINKKSEDDLRIIEILSGHGLKLELERSAWDTKLERSREDVMPASNMIFRRS